MSNSVKVGLSLMPTEDYRHSTSDLYSEGLVDCIEWSFDIPWNGSEVPDWCDSIIQEYVEKDGLLGHGVSFSPFSAGLSGGGFTEVQKNWLNQLQDECQERNYLQISEHFGFMQAGNYIDGAPLPVPMTKQAIDVGRRSLEAIREVSFKPVGLENLALAFCLDDVKNQGEFLETVLDSVEGFLLLDLHNLYCQAHNFDVPILELLKSYPLKRVTELHLAGGSFSKPASGSGKEIRRDTHDGAVPEEVFELLHHSLCLCPDLEFVIFERLGGTINSAEDKNSIFEDYQRILKVVADEQI